MDSDPELEIIFNRVCAGKNVVLVGPDRLRIAALLRHVSQELVRKNAFQSVVIREEKSAEDALELMLGQDHLVLCALPYAHALSAYAAFGAALGTRICEPPGLFERLLSEVLESVRCIGFVRDVNSPVQKGSFREKLEKASYTGKGQTDRAQRMRDWTSQNDCDPGWELDR